MQRQLLSLLLLSLISFSGCSGPQRAPAEPPASMGAPTAQPPATDRQTQAALADAAGGCGRCDAPNFCIASKCSPPGTVVTAAAIGSAPGQVGFQPANESAGEAPMSFAVRSDGKLLLLDQRLKRLQLFSGDRVERVIPIDSTYYQDVVLLSDEMAVLLDKYSRKELVVMDLRGSGSVVRRVPLTDADGEMPDEPSGMFSTRAGVFVVFDNAIQYLNADGSEASRRSVSALVSCDGKATLSAELEGQQLSVVRDSFPSPAHAEIFTHQFPTSIHSFWMSTDCQGNTYVVTGNFDLPKSDRAKLTVFDASFHVLRETSLVFPDTQLSADTFREYVLTPSGEFYHYVFTQGGIAFQRY